MLRITGSYKGAAARASDVKAASAAEASTSRVNGVFEADARIRKPNAKSLEKVGKPIRYIAGDLLVLTTKRQYCAAKRWAVTEADVCAA